MYTKSIGESVRISTYNNHGLELQNDDYYYFSSMNSATFRTKHDKNSFFTLSLHFLLASGSPFQSIRYNIGYPSMCLKCSFHYHIVGLLRQHRLSTLRTEMGTTADISPKLKRNSPIEHQPSCFWYLLKCYQKGKAKLYTNTGA